jgi:hypothetical protein
MQHVPRYETTHLHTPKDSGLYIHHCEYFKSRIQMLCCGLCLQLSTCDFVLRIVELK